MTVASTLRSQHRDDDTIVRAVGASAPHGLGPSGEALRAVLDRESGHSWRWVGGEGDARQRRYCVSRYAQSLGELALSPDRHTIAWRSALHAIGQALSRLHVPVPSQPDVPGRPTERGRPKQPDHDAPPALARLHAFLTSPLPAGQNWRRQQLMLAALGPPLVQALGDDARRAMAATDVVLTHGWAGLNNWYVIGADAVGLVGEDLGAARREHDLGSVLGQVVEFAAFVPGFARICPISAARDALLSGYGEVIDDSILAQEVRLAVARHLADYAGHTTGPESEFVRYSHLIGHLTGEGNPP